MQDTKIGGQDSKFPQTRWSAIVAVKSNRKPETQRAFEVIVTAYWKPAYKYIRIKWNKTNEDAKDLTQSFFAVAIEKGYFQKYDPEKARFRTYLRTCLDGFIANEEKAARRLKRGGGLQTLSLDFNDAEDELKKLEVSSEESVEEYFDKEWQRNLFSMSIARLQKDCLAAGKQIQFEIFKRYDLEGESETGKVTYDALANEFDIPVTQVTNYLAYARRELRRILLNNLREVTATEDEFYKEARELLGVDLK